MPYAEQMQHYQFQMADLSKMMVPASWIHWENISGVSIANPHEVDPFQLWPISGDSLSVTAQRLIAGGMFPERSIGGYSGRAIYPDDMMRWEDKYMRY